MDATPLNGPKALLLALIAMGCATASSEIDDVPDPWQPYWHVSELVVTSEPTGARIEVNGEEMGVTPLTARFQRGGLWGIPGHVVISAASGDSSQCARIQEVESDQPVPTSVFFDMTNCVAPDAARTHREYELDVKPQLVSLPVLEAPSDPESGGVPGRVLIETELDATGAVDETTLRVLYCSNDRFVAAARKFVLSSLWTPGEIGGTPVRVVVEMPIEFPVMSSQICSSGAPCDSPEHPGQGEAIPNRCGA